MVALGIFCSMLYTSWIIFSLVTLMMKKVLRVMQPPIFSSFFWLLLFGAWWNALEEICFEFVAWCAQCVIGVFVLFFLNIFLLIFSFFNAKWWTSPRLGAKSKGFLHPQKCLIGILCWLVIWPSHREANASYLSNSLHLVHSSVL